MKVGSIVECVDASNQTLAWGDAVKLKQVYTIRAIADWFSPSDGVYLEEIISRSHPVYGEVPYNIERFRELLPPMEIQSALDESIPVLIER